MDDDDGETILEIRPGSPADDHLAKVMDWVGLSAAIGMIVAAVIMAS